MDWITFNDRWISVKEQLPKKGERILAIIPGFRSSVKMKYDVDGMGQFHWWVDGMDGTLYNDNVTYWKNLKRNKAAQKEIL